MAKSGKKRKGQPPPLFKWFLGQIFRLLRKFGNIGITWTGIGYCAYQFASAVRIFAGVNSTANLAFSFITSISFVWSVSITVSGVSIALYMRERRLHRENRKRMAARNMELELRIDPMRTSSKLDPQGLTRKEDE